MPLMGAGLAGPSANIDPPLVGLLARFRADTGVTDAGAGRVSAWADMMAVGPYDLAQGTADNRPLLVTNAVNGQPIIRFDRSRPDALARTTTPNINQPYCLAAVCAWTTGNGWMWGANNNFRCMGHFSAEPTIFAGGFVDNNTPVSAGVFHSFIGQFDGASSDIIVNGSSTTVDAGTGAFNAGLIVGSGPGGSDPWSGDVAELFLYDHKLDAGEISTFLAYVAQQYGV